ncbi:hypothetical protein ILYODFUR_003371 [Ilyodon furcidens]|uniref:Uncharacterized protein n=1 Tax=Ilyodon furcidens TaxID=33524 RepID=A0ABV0TGW1_9TELE
MVSLFSEGSRLSKNSSSSSLKMLNASAELISVSVVVCLLRLGEGPMSWWLLGVGSATAKLVVTTGRGSSSLFLSSSCSFSRSSALPDVCGPKTHSSYCLKQKTKSV